MPKHRISRRPVLAGVLVLAALLASGAVLAQTPSCEQFKTKLTARIARGSGTFRILSVPSGETVPAGGRVVGNCGGGQWTLVLLTEVAVDPKPATSAPVREAGDSRRPEPIAVVPTVIPADAQPTLAAASQMPPAIASAPVPTPAQVAAPASAAPSAWERPAFETLLWVGGMAVLLITVVAGRRIARRLRYDAAGLPRGPRLR